MKKILCLSIVFLLVLGGASFAQESIIETIQKQGVIRVGMSTFVPWAMKDKQGNLVGFEIDVAKKLANDMGIKIEFVPTAWSGIIPALLTGKFDVIIGGMGITPKRNLKVNFTIPYDYSGMSMVAHKARAKGFSFLDDFNKKDVSIAARMGTTAEQAVRKHMPNASLKLFENESQALQELNLGRVHAVVSSAPMPVFHALKYPDKLFVPIKENFTREPIGFAIRKGDHDALNYLNNWILNMYAQGFLKEKKAYWFESKKWEDLVK
ncbi:MAG: transporter substrate-binding domain-containing protein [Desulfobacula sp.]|uniref:transporter substrate-binding domain-containing protein n=1 Tax=Desulfobacula sp. TaxID=2593537 RepID=UPI0025B91933|nr:transporter substrate-binding domain-containing protein [Desulfobacula sp.]MCD4720328.1 transporter substrate-binding domain-containing protein [Desulfobacula sp.]